MAFLEELINNALLHQCTLKSTGAFDQYAEPTLGEASNRVRCLASGSKTRTVGQNTQNVLHNFVVQFDAGTVVGINDEISNVTDQFGGVIFNTGTVVAIQGNQSMTEGKVGTSVFVRSEK